MKKNIKIFTDFDGTIALNDVGDKLFSTFADVNWEQPIQDWKDGLISSKELYIREWAMTKVTKEQLKQFCDAQQIDPYFKEFVDFCDRNSYTITVLSDGFDFYIQRILKNNGFDALEIYANKIIFENEDKVRPEFPYFGKGCPNCANCKGYHIGASRKDGELIIYIGDGLSDRCGVSHADVIFAKDDLKKYCIEEKIPFYEFNNFNDVLTKLKEFAV